MPLSTVRRVVDQLKAAENLEKIFLNGYDEPTLNPRLLDAATIVDELNTHICILTNGTRLSEDLLDGLHLLKSAVTIDIHLSAAEPEEFRRVHQSPLREVVMKNLDRAAAKNFRSDFKLVIGMQSSEPSGLEHRDQVLLEERYRDTAIGLERYIPNDRAGLLGGESSDSLFHSRISGCGSMDRTGSWLHINANSRVVLCCQDYMEDHEIGNVDNQSIATIFQGERRRTYHAWTTGAEDAPDDYICRRCSHAISETSPIDISVKRTGFAN